MRALNYSKQRQVILDSLHSRKDHPSAEMVYESVRQVFPNISLGTVYRNLNLLADHGMIRRIKGLNDAEHFDGDISRHQHFICKCCDSVEDIFLEADSLLDSLDDAAQKLCSGKIVSNDIYFFGVCSKCSAASDNEAINNNVQKIIV